MMRMRWNRIIQGSVPLSLVAILLVLGGLVTTLHAQDGADSTRRVDTLPPRNDHGLLLDSALADSAIPPPSRAADSLRRLRSRLPREHGDPLGAVVSDIPGPGVEFITKRDLVWRRYFTLFDALRRDLPAYSLSLGGPGLVQAFSYAGADPSSIAMLYNGRPLHGVGDLAYDIENWPTEFADRYEILRGARSLLYGSGDALLAINVVQPRYDVEGSYVRIWYEQGENNTTSADLTFARNVGSGGNLALGFRRIASDGIYVSGNQKVSNWSGRGALTFYTSPALTLSLTEVFTDATHGLNGGLTPTSPRSPLAAGLAFEDLVASERTLRHDLTLAARYHPNATTTLDSLQKEISVVDTTVRLDGDLYYSYAEREFTFTRQDTTRATATTNSVQGRAGLRGGLRLPLAFAGLLGNGVVEIDNVGRFRAEGGGLLEIRGGEQITLRAGAKLFVIGDESSVALVSEVAVRLDSISLRGTLRAANPINPVQIDAANDTLHYLSFTRTPILAEGEIRWTHDRAALSLSATFRRVEPIAGAVPFNMISADIGATIPLPFNTIFDNHTILTLAPSGDHRFPLAHTLSDLYTHWRLLAGNLDLRLGTTLEYQTSLRALRFDNTTATFFDPEDAAHVNVISYPIWNAYVQARIGNAYLRVEMRNILNNEYYTVYRYPVWGRGLYLGANWALVD